MTIIVFLVDTSSSMRQRSYVSMGRLSLLDVAKGAVETFVKLRQKSSEARGDRYMLLTFEEFPKNIKAGWKENLITFMNELKNLEANGMSTMGSALKQVFDILNINRMQTGIDMYGQGRYPFYLEPAVIIVITDGGRLTTSGGVIQSELNLPMHSAVPGAELTREPFRWDQRLYALVLRMTGTPPTAAETAGNGHVAGDHSPIDAMCEVTGGRSYAVTSKQVLHQCIDSLVQKLQSGVVIHFEKFGPDPLPITQTATVDLDQVQNNEPNAVTANNLNDCDMKDNLESEVLSRPMSPSPTVTAGSNTQWHNCRRLIYVQRSAQKGFAVGFWPLPESFQPDCKAPSLQQRTAHPNVKFTCNDREPMVIDNLPFDKYELDPSPLTLYILARKQPKICWQVFIQGSSNQAAATGEHHPFGYLKASNNLLSVNLYVLPYNYPVLLPLLDDLFKVHRLKPTPEWRSAFGTYLQTMPAYYAAPLRRVLTRMGAGSLSNSLIPEAMDNCLSFSVLSYLKRLKSAAKVEYDKTLVTASTTANSNRLLEGIKVSGRSLFKKELLSDYHPRLRFNAKVPTTDYSGFLVRIKDSTVPVGFRNAFDIPRNSILDQLVRMRANFLRPVGVKLMDTDTQHSLPIGQMGNYQDYLKKMPVPLREIEYIPMRQHMFGNPFKINNFVPEEGVDEVGLNNNGTADLSAIVPPRNTQRRNSTTVSDPSSPHIFLRGKKGPLPPDFVYHRNKKGDKSLNVVTPPRSENDSMFLSENSVSGNNIANETKCDILPTNSYSAAKITNCVSGRNDSSQTHDRDFEDDSRSDVISSDVWEQTFQDGHPKKASKAEPSLEIISSETSEKSIDSRGYDVDLDESSNRTEDFVEDWYHPNNGCDLRSVRLRNQNMRQLINKEVKRPGKDHQRLLDMLGELYGPTFIKRQYIREVIHEALRFKRRRLADILEDNMEELSASAGS